MIFSAFFFFNRLYQSAIRKLFAINQYRTGLTVVQSLKAFSGKGSNIHLTRIGEKIIKRDSSPSATNMTFVMRH